MTVFTLTLHGAPLATVDLPADRTWAGGRITPLPAFDSVVSLLATAAEAPAVAEALLDLPSGESLPTASTEGVPPAVAAAYRELAGLSFDLLDEAGLPAGAELVRLAPSGAPPNAVVRVFFRHAPGRIAARSEPAPREGGGSAKASSA